MSASSEPTPEAHRGDPFLCDVDRLLTLASEAVVRRGIAYHNDHRVFELGWDATRLWAQVEGSNRAAPYAVEIGLDTDRELLVSCSCPFDYEPACKHVVAVLVAYAARAEAEAVDSAAEQAIRDRQQRGRTEVVAEHRSGLPAFGTWSAWTVTRGGAQLRPYSVHIRSTRERINACGCADFASNRLGTCKHIEAVLHRLKKQKVGAHEPPLAVVYLSWSDARAAHGRDASAHDDAGPRIKLRLPAAPSDELRAALERHFDARGELAAPLPDAWDALVRELGDHPEVHLGDDARAHALRVTMDLAHAARRDAIRAEIERAGGHLPGVRARLYPYQTEGVAFLASTGRAVLADDMGLGKTLQALAAARWLIDHEGVRRVLVVCPASLKTQWQREIVRFSGLDAIVVEGGAAPRLAQYRQGAPFTIVNYELVVRDLAAITTELAPDLLILDEAQRIKNWRTKTAASIKGLVTRYAFVLSGTPLENRLEDLYSIMQVVDGRVLGPLWQFLLRFHVSDERGKVIAYRNLSELRLRLRPVMLRRDKRLVRDQLPERVVQTVPVPLSDRQRELHDGALLRAAAFTHIMKRRPLTPAEEKELLASLQTARMACDAAGLVDRDTVGSPKLDELARILEAVCVDGGDKIVVFSQWERMTRMAEEVVTALGLGVVRLHGGVSTRDRGRLVDRFREDPDVQVFLSTDAGASGLNLQSASVLVNLDMPWNPAVIEQRIGRVHRLGQTQPVHVFNLIASASYEERVAELVRTKAALFVSAIEPDADGDVIAVDKRLVELAAEASAGLVPPAEDAEPVVAAPLAAAGDEAAVEVAVADAVAVDVAAIAPRSTAYRRDEGDDLGPVVEGAVRAAEQAFAGHIEAMIVRRTGLVVIVPRVIEDMVARAEALSLELPVAVMDRRTWELVARMGRPAAAAEPEPVRAEAPLVTLARQRLVAAEALIERELAAPALELLAGALLARVAADAEKEAAPDGAGAAAWLFGEAVPKGFASLEIANAVLRAQGLARSPAVPEALVRELAELARAYLS